MSPAQPDIEMVVSTAPVAVLMTCTVLVDVPGSSMYARVPSGLMAR